MGVDEYSVKGPQMTKGNFSHVFHVYINNIYFFLVAFQPMVTALKGCFEQPHVSFLLRAPPKRGGFPSWCSCSNERVPSKKPDPFSGDPVGVTR